MPSENISDGILSVMLPNTVNNILSRLFQTAFEKQGVSVKYSGLNLNQDKATKPQTIVRKGAHSTNSTARRGRQGEATLYKFNSLYYRWVWFAAISCLLLSAVFIAPYLTAFHEQEKTFEYAELTVTAPNRSGRAIKLDADGQHYRLSCYGFDSLCTGGNIGRTIRAEQVRAVLSETVGKGFLNGVLLEYRNSGSVYKQ
ncbi:IS1106 transposase [Neisseria meningitidis]|nr:IS1106 transposase [Neisseria meningitidis]